MDRIDSLMLSIYRVLPKNLKKRRMFSILKEACMQRHTAPKASRPICFSSSFFFAIDKEADVEIFSCLKSHRIYCTMANHTHKGHGYIEIRSQNIWSYIPQYCYHIWVYSFLQQELGIRVDLTFLSFAKKCSKIGKKRMKIRPLPL